MKVNISKKTFILIKGAISVFVIVGVLFLLRCCFQLATIPSGSMLPTLQIHEICLVKRTRDIRRGDIIIFRPFAGDRKQYAKRAVALEGDRVAIRDGKLYLNGVAQDEPYLNEPYMDGDMPEYTVPDGCFWAMGDNRNHSVDSRYYGAFPRERLVGKVIFHF